MKPGFALSLSFDGIRLLHRAAGGWRVVGDVALDAADMAGELEVLRKTASALEPGGVRSKVLLPNEQIKYLTIDTPEMDEAARRAAAALALDGATPYAVDDLAFDISVDGNQTHIAAVARETLAEAEAFANEHRFHAVSFAAMPGDNGFLGEPYFGQSDNATALLEPGESVEPDGIAVVVIGDVTVPDGPVAAPPATTSEPSQAEAGTKPDTPEPEQETASEPPLAPTVKTTTDDGPAVSDKPAEPVAAPKPPEPNVNPASQAAPSVDAAPQVTPGPTLGFASRRAAEPTKAPQLGGALRKDTATAPKADTPAPATGSVTAGAIVLEPDPAPPAPKMAPPAPVAATPAPPASAPTPAPEKTGFLSRRRNKPARQPAAPAAPAQPAAMAATADTEQERMTVFGARKSQVGGKPRFLGLILTAALLVFLAGVAAWASVFLDDGLKLSQLFGQRAAPQVAEVEPQQPAPEDDESPVGIVTASLEPALTEEDAAVLDALRDPVQPQAPQEPSAAELAAQYAATGIWPRAPDVPPEPPGLVDIEDLYLTSIDPVSTSTDAVALPPVTGFETDQVMASISSPAAAGTQFALDAQGLVIPTASGALSPDGFTVFLGQPPLVPPATPTRFQSVPEDTAIRSALAAVRPTLRPSNLVENTERAQLDGLTRTELAGYRPALRPQSLQQQAEAETPEPAVAPEVTDGAVALALATPNPIENATKYAVRASIRPDIRPRNFAAIVKRAERRKPAEEVRVASAATVAPRVVQPKIPSKTSVAKQATVRNALNLRKINLIGVYGKPSSRRALVRLGNGRYQKVVVGDRIDGGRVSAIGEGELRYTKRGRDLVLKMPR